MTDAAFVGAIPEIYERCLGPMLFEPYARDLGRRFKGFDGELLETAAGTGRVTRALAEAAPNAAITATDLNAPMLAEAERRVCAPNVRYEPADAQDLPFPSERFDALVCQFGVMFYPDKPGSFAEAWRVLRPGGRYVFSVWDDLALNEIAQVVHKTVAGRFRGDPPGFLARTPYGWNDGGMIERVLRAAGFVDVAIEAVRLPTPCAIAAHAAEGFCCGTPLRGEIESRGDLGATLRSATEALETRFGQGPFSAPASALIVTAQR